VVCPGQVHEPSDNIEEYKERPKFADPNLPKNAEEAPKAPPSNYGTALEYLRAPSGGWGKMGGVRLVVFTPPPSPSGPPAWVQHRVCDAPPPIIIVNLLMPVRHLGLHI
jgi:hypothetical protein